MVDVQVIYLFFLCAFVSCLNVLPRECFAFKTRQVNLGATFKI